jgi:hypothetical protein
VEGEVSKRRARAGDGVDQQVERVAARKEVKASEVGAEENRARPTAEQVRDFGFENEVGDDIGEYGHAEEQHEAGERRAPKLSIQRTRDESPHSHERQ